VEPGSGKHLDFASDDTSHVAHRIQKMVRFLDSGKIFKDEFLYNALLFLLDGGNANWRIAIRTMNHALRMELIGYCENEMQGDFTRVARPFLAGEPSREELETKAAALRLECGVLIRDLSELSTTK
jgi:hypothetical protein